ncbi:hypothetical protein RIB2604_02113240 [Aspergillus luchuensis]|uniref:FAS1 domain-containing protein n=1 Tax=Aspergillus kawachii TaxID=1069201 RepID=A0A146FP71_ASPKA|nr:hypothetical protein RIB2604_02113240 [Aspergillus luchuensis]
MKFSAFPALVLLSLSSLVTATTDPLNYRNISGYVASSSSIGTTALDFIKSRSDLSILSEKIDELGGFAQAFDTDPDWKFTFFAPNNNALKKGKWWLGNTIIHHYVPNSELTSASFNETLQRFQGVVHIIDRILDPSAQIFESDLPRMSQTFIAGSCSNPQLSYC